MTTSYMKKRTGWLAGQTDDHRSVVDIIKIEEPKLQKLISKHDKAKKELEEAEKNRITFGIDPALRAARKKEADLNNAVYTLNNKINDLKIKSDRLFRITMASDDMERCKAEIIDGNKEIEGLERSIDLLEKQIDEAIQNRERLDCQYSLEIEKVGEEFTGNLEELEPPAIITNIESKIKIVSAREKFLRQRLQENTSMLEDFRPLLVSKNRKYKSLQTTVLDIKMKEVIEKNMDVFAEAAVSPFGIDKSKIEILISRDALEAAKKRLDAEVPVK